EGRREAEREERVADGDDALGVEHAVVHSALDSDQGRSPPGDQGDEGHGRNGRGEDGNTELADDPATAGDALSPVESVGAALEIGDERGGEEDADEARHECEPRDEVAERAELVGELAGRRVANTALKRAGA